MRVDGGGGRWRVRVGVGVEWRVEREEKMLAYMEVQLTTAILKAGHKCKDPLANRPDEYILFYSDVLIFHISTYV